MNVCGCVDAKSGRSGRSIKLLGLSRLFMRDAERKSDKLALHGQKGRSFLDEAQSFTDSI